MASGFTSHEFDLSVLAVSNKYFGNPYLLPETSQIKFDIFSKAINF